MYMIAIFVASCSKVALNYYISKNTICDFNVIIILNTIVVLSLLIVLMIGDFVYRGIL